MGRTLSVAFDFGFDLRVAGTLRPREPTPTSKAADRDVRSTQPEPHNSIGYLAGVRAAFVVVAGSSSSRKYLGLSFEAALMDFMAGMASRAWVIRWRRSGEDRSCQSQLGVRRR